MDERLVQAEQLAENGQRDEAHDIVMAIVEADKTNFDAWSALVELAKTDVERRKAIYRMWALRPDDPHTNILFDKLTSGTLPPLNNSEANFSSRKHDKHYPQKQEKVTKSFLGYAILVMFSYLFLWIIGLALNIHFLFETEKAERDPQILAEHTGCIWFMLLAGPAYCLCVFLIGVLYVITRIS